MCTQPASPGGNGRPQSSHTARGGAPRGTDSRYAILGRNAPAAAPKSILDANDPLYAALDEPEASQQPTHSEEEEAEVATAAAASA